MASTLILGIVPTSDPSHVESLISEAEAVDASRLKVLSAQSGGGDSAIAFVQLAGLARNDLTGSMMRGTGVLSDFGGTSVPGLAGVASLDAFSHPSVRDYFSDTAVPRGEAEGYNDAIADGRCVVLYTCAPDDAHAAESALRAAGVLEVRAY